MNLRIALKIWKAVGTPRETAYSDGKIGAASRRHSRLKSTKATHDWWIGFLQDMTPSGRASVVKRWSPKDALEILMQEDAGDWHKPYKEILGSGYPPNRGS